MSNNYMYSEAHNTKQRTNFVSFQNQPVNASNNNPSLKKISNVLLVFLINSNKLQIKL